MKNLRKIALAPALLALSITACSGQKLSEDEAKKRIDGYDAKAVVEKYASAKVVTKVEIKKATGVFDDQSTPPGAMAMVTAGIRGMAGEDLAEGEDVAEMVFSTDTFFKGEEVTEVPEGVTITYYSYKKTGLKAEMTQDMTNAEMGNMHIKGEATYYVLDDGRIEKAKTHAVMSIDTESAGVAFKGELEYTAEVSVTWTAK